MFLCAFYAAALGGGCEPPPQAGFEALVPPAAIWACAGQNWFRYAERRHESLALARALDRCWKHNAPTEKTTGVAASFDMLLLVQSFDASLWALDQHPTVSNAVARIRAYRPIIAFVCEQIRNGAAEDVAPKPGRFKQPQTQLYRFRSYLNDQYGSLFTRSG